MTDEVGRMRTSVLKIRTTDFNSVFLEVRTSKIIHLLWNK